MELFKIMSDILQNKYNYNQIKVEQKKIHRTKFTTIKHNTGLQKKVL